MSIQGKLASLQHSAFEFVSDRVLSTAQKYAKMAAMTSAASVSDALSRLGLDYQHEMVGVRTQTPGQLLFGQAVTLRSLPTRPDLIEYLTQQAGGDRLKMPFDLAVEATTEGKVLVVDTSGQTHATIGGDTKYSRLVATKAAGLVTDGALRDQQDFVKFGFPFYCAGFSPRSGTRHYLFPSDFNVPVTCGGALVRPGDYLIGDNNGVVVIPEGQVEIVLKMGIMKEKMDKFVRKKIERDNVPGGLYYPPTEELLKEFAESVGLQREQLPF